MNLTTQIKAETIAAAIYTITDIKPDVIYRESERPEITFSKENGRKMKDFLFNQMKKKSDVYINFLPIVKPVIFADILPYLVLGAAGIFIAGYCTGQAH